MCRWAPGAREGSSDSSSRQCRLRSFPCRLAPVVPRAPWHRERLSGASHPEVTASLEALLCRLQRCVAGYRAEDKGGSLPAAPRVDIAALSAGSVVGRHRLQVGLELLEQLLAALTGHADELLLDLGRTGAEGLDLLLRSEEHTSELHHVRISYA